MSAKIPPKPSKDTIYVDVDDEITSIIDKVENSEHKVVALVLPKRAASLQSIVNMKLLKRSADSSGKNIVLITSEHALIPLAGAAKLHVAKNLQSAPEIPDAPIGAAAATKAAIALEATEDNSPSDAEEELPGKIDYSKPVGALALKHEAENPETIDLDDDEEKPIKASKSKSPKVPKVTVPDFDKFRVMMVGGALAVVALIVFLFLANSVLPNAKITLHTTSEPVQSNFTLSATPTAPLDPAKGTMPSKLETTDQTGQQQVTATGQQNNGTKATGSVTMTTCVSSPGQLNDVPSGSGISTNGLTYITQQKASFSNYAGACGGGFKFQSNSVSISAQQAGSKFNTSLSSASVAGYSGVSADGSASGGTDNIVTILSQSDVDGAKQKLTSTSGDQFVKDFEKKLSDQGEYVLASTLKTSDAQITASPSVGQPASTANVSIKITYTVLTVKKDDLKQAIQAKLASQIDKKKQKLNDNFMDDANITVQSQSAPNSAVIAVNEDTTAVPIIDQVSVKKVAEGKKSGDVQTALNAWPGVKSVDVKLGPFWVSKVPKKDSKVTVILKEEKASSDKSAP